MDLFSGGRALLSPRLSINWLGFQSNTMTMQRYGWRFLVEMEDYDRTVHIFAEHKRDGFKAISKTIESEYMMRKRYKSEGYLELPPIELTMASDITVAGINPTLVSMQEMEIFDDSPIRQNVEYQSIDFFFNKFEPPKISRKIQNEISLDPETIKRRLDLFPDRR